MTQQEAKALSIEVWQYLADHPEIGEKLYLPTKIYRKIKRLHSRCPLCDVLFHAGILYCCDCPLCLQGQYCNERDSAWKRWNYSTDIATRQQAAQQILGIIKAWEPEEETL